MPNEDKDEEPGKPIHPEEQQGLKPPAEHELPPDTVEFMSIEEFRRTRSEEDKKKDSAEARTIVKSIESTLKAKGELKEESTKLEKWAKVATTGRDLVVVVVGAIYVLGYLSWTVYSYSGNIGPVQFSQPQLIASGCWAILFILTLVTFYVVGTAIGQSISKKSTRFVMVLATTILAVVIGIQIICSALCGKNAFFESIQTVVFTAFCTLTSGMVGNHQLESNNKEEGKSQRNIVNVAAVLLICFYVIMISPKISAIESKIPQEFGGTKPRLAYLSLRRADLTDAETTSLLTPSDQVTNKDSKPVVRSLPVEVVYDNGDVLEVQPYKATDNAMYEIKRANVVNIEWYGYDTPHIVTAPVATKKPTVKPIPKH